MLQFLQPKLCAFSVNTKILMSSLKGHDRTAIVTESVRNPITWFAIFRHSAAFCIAEDDFLANGDVFAVSTNSALLKMCKFVAFAKK